MDDFEDFANFDPMLEHFNSQDNYFPQGPDNVRLAHPGQRSKSSSDSQVRLHIGKIPHSLSEKGLRFLLGKVAKPDDVCMRPPNGKFKYAFADYSSLKDALSVIQEISGKPPHHIIIDFANPIKKKDEDDELKEIFLRISERSSGVSNGPKDSYQDQETTVHTTDQVDCVEHTKLKVNNSNSFTINKSSSSEKDTPCLETEASSQNRLPSTSGVNEVRTDLKMGRGVCGANFSIKPSGPQPLMNGVPRPRNVLPKEGVGRGKWLLRRKAESEGPHYDRTSPITIEERNHVTVVPPIRDIPPPSVSNLEPEYNDIKPSLVSNSKVKKKDHVTFSVCPPSVDGVDANNTHTERTGDSSNAENDKPSAVSGEDNLSTYLAAVSGNSNRGLCFGRGKTVVSRMLYNEKQGCSVYCHNPAGLNRPQEFSYCDACGRLTAQRCTTCRLPVCSLSCAPSVPHHSTDSLGNLLCLHKSQAG